MTSSVHPGEILREDLVAALGLTVGDAATRLGISRTTLSRVLHGHARVSRNLAARLEQAGEGTARAWLAMQSVHDLAAEPAAGGPKVQHRGPRSALVHRVTAEPHGSILHAPLPMEAYKVLVKVVASMRAGDSPLKGGRELPRHQSSDAGQAAGARRDLVRTSCLGQASTAAAERRPGLPATQAGRPTRNARCADRAGRGGRAVRRGARLHRGSQRCSQAPRWLTMARFKRVPRCLRPGADLSWHRARARGRQRHPFLLA
ncbi:MAG TPA: HigA family addiction module antitoxin [Dermatophilaceae bacterium]|jgi:addiction module HigA family antidote